MRVETDEDDPVPRLRYAEVGGLQPKADDFVSRLERSENVIPYVLVESRINQARNVFRYEGCGLYGDYRRNESRPHVSFIGVSSPSACNGEWLARRASMDHVNSAAVG